MPEPPPNAARTSHHPPARGDAEGAESPGETVERISQREVAPEPVEGAELVSDPSTSRGLLRLLAWRYLLGGLAAGAIVGAGIAALAFFALGEGALGGDESRWGVAAGIVLGAAAIGAIFSGLWNLAREDGRVQREIEHDHPSARGGPARGSRERFDPPATRDD